MENRFQAAATLVENAAVIIFLCLAGCTTPSQQLESPSELRIGQPQEEVRKIFGAPKRSETGSNGRTLDVFVTLLPKMESSDSRLKVFEVRSMHVLYNEQGKVVNFSHYAGELKGFTKLNKEWQAGPWLAPEKVTAIQRGTTSRDALLRVFGPATIQGLNVYGDPVMSWMFMEGGKTTGTIRGRELLVLFNANLTVRDYLLRDFQP